MGDPASWSASLGGTPGQFVEDRFWGDSGKILSMKWGDLRGTLSEIGRRETLNPFWGSKRNLSVVEGSRDSLPQFRNAS